jgi:hypothetical protein
VQGPPVRDITDVVIADAVTPHVVITDAASAAITDAVMTDVVVTYRLVTDANSSCTCQYTPPNIVLTVQSVMQPSLIWSLLTL